MSIGSKLLLLRLPPTQLLLPARVWKNQGTQYVFVRHTVAVREVWRTVLHIFSS